MAFDINSFRTNGLTFGGARPSQFQVELSAPPGVTLAANALRKFTFTCQGASLPAAIEGTIQAPYFGRKIKLAGDREYDNWPVQVMNDEDFAVKAMFEKWNSVLNTTIGNVRDSTLTVENDYKADMRVVQYGKNGQIIRAYIMTGAWPTRVGDIGLNWSTTNEFEVFGVEFAYDWWLPDSVGVTGLDQVVQ
jgi:hypothetical protein